VQNSFTVSGFLYHSDSQQILLRQHAHGNENNLVFFGENGKHGSDPQTVFQHCMEKALGISIASSSIHPVYDYIHTQLGENFIFFVEITNDTHTRHEPVINSEWIPMAKITKFPMSEQTRHDIIIGQRVIRSLKDAAAALPSPESN
jgi:hypothetical protein